MGALDADIAAAAAALESGEVVAYPTETFYGLGVAAREEALERLLVVKGRDAAKGLSLLISADMLDLVVAEVSPRARALIAAHWPGPLTLALPARPGLPAALVKDGCVAVRESPHPVARALVAAFGGPVTATSANPAGQAPPTSAAGVRGHFPSGVVILDGGETAGGLPSTLARVRGDVIEVLRPGPVVVG